MNFQATVNTHDQLIQAGGGVAIMTAYFGSRHQSVSGWHVYRIFRGKAVVTDKNAGWYDYGRKHFGLLDHGGTFHEQRRAALEKAKAWVAKTYGEKGPWVRNRIGDYVPKRINDEFPIPKAEAD